MSLTKIKLSSVTFVSFGFILNVTTTIWIIGIIKIALNPGTAYNVAARFFLLFPYHVTKPS